MGALCRSWARAPAVRRGAGDGDPKMQRPDLWIWASSFCGTSEILCNGRRLLFRYAYAGVEDVSGTELQASG